MPRTLSYLLPALLLSAAVACATTVQAPTDAPALGSDAKIVAKKNKTGNYAVSINVSNLAPANRLDGEATTFVVWLINQDQPAVRAGSLAYDEGDRAGDLAERPLHRSHHPREGARPGEPERQGHPDGEDRRSLIRRRRTTPPNNTAK